MRDLSEKEMNKIIAKFVSDIEEREHEKALFKKEKLESTIEKLIPYLQVNTGMDDDFLLYHPEKSPISMEEFNLTYEILQAYAEEMDRFGEEEDNPFENKLSFVRFGEYRLILRTMYGQGCSQQILSADKDNGYWLDSLSYSVQEVIDHNHEKRT